MSSINSSKNLSLDGFSPQIEAKILDIIWDNNISSLTSLTSSKALSLLDENKDNSELAEAMASWKIESILYFSPEIQLKFLSKVVKKDKKIAFKILENNKFSDTSLTALIREFITSWAWFNEATAQILSILWEEKFNSCSVWDKIEDFYDSLNKNSSEITQFLNNIKANKSDFYSLLWNNVLAKSGLSFSPSYILNLAEESASELGYFKSSSEKFNKIQIFLSENLATYKNEAWEFYDEFVELLALEVVNVYDKFVVKWEEKPVKKSLQEKIEELPSGSEPKTENNPEKPDTEGDKSSFEYSALGSSYGGFDYGDFSPSDLDLPDEDLKKMSPKSIEKYINFIDFFKETWLSFLWEKYRWDFLALLHKNWISFDYASSEGLSEGDLVSALNLVWRNTNLIWNVVWVDENWDEISLKEVKRIDDLSSFKTLFKDVNSSWKIWSESYNTTDSSKSSLHQYMVFHSLVDPNEPKLYTTKFDK